MQLNTQFDVMGHILSIYITERLSVVPPNLQVLSTIKNHSLSSNANGAFSHALKPKKFSGDQLAYLNILLIYFIIILL
jgi:hypothetical protein